VPAIRHGKASIAAKTEKRWNGPGYSLIEKSPKKTSKMLILSCVFVPHIDRYFAIVYSFRKLIFDLANVAFFAEFDQIYVHRYMIK